MNSRRTNPLILTNQKIKVAIQVCALRRLRTVARKFSIGGLCVFAGELDIVKLTKTPLIYSVSIWGGLELCLGGDKPTKAPPVATGLRTLCVDHRVNLRLSARLPFKSLFLIRYSS